MARALTPVWAQWTNNDGETYIVGDLGYDLEGGDTPIAEVSNEGDAKLLVMVLDHIDARLP